MNVHNLVFLFSGHPVYFLFDRCETLTEMIFKSLVMAFQKGPWFYFLEKKNIYFWKYNLKLNVLIMLQKLGFSDGPRRWAEGGQHGLVKSGVRANALNK